jgi:hypothetical protein
MVSKGIQMSPSSPTGDGGEERKHDQLAGDSFVCGCVPCAKSTPKKVLSQKKLDFLQKNYSWKGQFSPNKSNFKKSYKATKQ